MLNASRTIVCFSLVFVMSCGRNNSGTVSISDYNTIVQSAVDMISECHQLEELYPETNHFITHFGMDQKQWINSEVYLDNGVSITVQYKIDVDYQKKVIKSYEKFVI